MKDGTLLHGSIGFGNCPKMLTGEESGEIRNVLATMLSGEIKDEVRQISPLCRHHRNPIGDFRAFFLAAKI